METNNNSGDLVSENEKNYEEHTHVSPEYLGSLDDISDNVIKSALEKYESEIVESDVENTIVITKSGHCR